MKVGLNGKVRTGNILIYVFLTLGVIIMMVPFYFMLLTSFSREANVQLPYPPRFWLDHWSLYNYSYILKNFRFFSYFFNSILISGGVLLFTVISSLMTGYGFSKLRMPFKKQLFIFCLSAMMIPFVTIMFSQYNFFKSIGLINSYWIFYLSAFTYSYYMFFAKQYIDDLPGSLRESALIDGASELKIFFRIYCPLCGPIISAVAVLAFIASYNDLLGPMLFISDKAKFSLQMAIASFTTGGNYYVKGKYYGVNTAISCVSTIPLIIVFLFFQRYIVESIAVTGLKQ